jgi:hypothetical protein
VVFGIRAGSARNQANIVAFNNLYVNSNGTGLCSGTLPNVMWAYYVGDTNGTPDVVRTSPVLSLDGKEVAFVENRDNATGGAYFHVLTWVANQGTITSPATPGSGGSSVRSVKYSSLGNRRSSPFVDYWRNVAFVGANDGKLYAIWPVFNTADQLKVLGQVTVNSGRVLSSPVMDPGANRIFVSDGNTLYCYSYGGSFSLAGSYSIGTTDKEAVQDAAVVDVDRQRVFWFARQGPSSALVIETDYSCGDVKTASIGGNTTTVIRAGAFDDDHYSGKGGQLHVCGKESNSDLPRLYTFGFYQSNGQWVWNNSPDYVNSIATRAGECSPLTTFKSLDQDRLFLGFSGTNEVQMWNIPISGSSDGPDATAGPYNGGSAGIIVDNRSSTAEANNIYFQTVLASTACGNKVCAVKLTQSGLQ